jgi:hypothetical protein
MDTCEEWMSNPTAKCLFWGIIIIVLLLVLYDLRSQEEIYANPHWIDGIGTNFAAKSNLSHAVHGSAPEKFQDPDWINGIGSNFAAKSNLGHAAHGSAPEHFKLPPGSGPDPRAGLSGPSREALLDIEQFSNASCGVESRALQSALGGGNPVDV